VSPSDRVPAHASRDQAAAPGGAFWTALMPAYSLSSALSAILAAVAATALLACGGASASAPRARAAPEASAGEVQLVGDLDPTRPRLVVDPVADAADAIAAGDLDAATATLQKVVLAIPTGWKPARRVGTSLEIAAWSPEDLMSQLDGTERTVTWIAPSYSRALYLLGFIAIERGDLLNATMFLDASLSFEQHPDAMTERAVLAQQAKTLDLALDLYTQVSTASRSSDLQRARAWRGRGSVLIDMNRLYDAEAAYRTSLELQPDHRLALAQLDYIAKRRTGEAEAVEPTITK
jgi:tetratricopeptide (TPR) repeat protein